MHIDPHVYLVGSGQLGFDLTNLFDCNIYLFDSGSGGVLFDAGAGLECDRILEVCRQDRIDPAGITHLWLTHAHTDHGGGTAHLRERLPGLRVWTNPATAKIVTLGDEAAVSLPPAKAAGSYPADYVYRPGPVDHVVEHGQVVEVGRLRIEVISTPGHSHDHHCYLVTDADLNKRYLVGGDAIFYGGKIVLQNTYDCSVPESIASIQRLAGYEFEALLAGHFNFSLSRGKRHVAAALSVIEKLGCPVSIV